MWSAAGNWSGRWASAETSFAGTSTACGEALCPIAADQRGYYYAETAAEVYATIRSLEKMRSGVDAAISGLERALEKFGE